MTHRNQAGRATGSLVLLLLGVTVAGGWNYHRNLQIEKASDGNRPYQSYTEDDLTALRAAYDQELKGSQANFDSAKSNRSRPQSDLGSIAGNVEQFQNTTRASSAIRDAAARVTDRESQIGAIDRELTMRSEFGEGLARHIKRLTTI